jgi:hypothetical protein
VRLCSCNTVSFGWVWMALLTAFRAGLVERVGIGIGGVWERMTLDDWIGDDDSDTQFGVDSLAQDVIEIRSV